MKDAAGDGYGGDGVGVAWEGCLRNLSTWYVLVSVRHPRGDVDYFARDGDGDVYPYDPNAGFDARDDLICHSRGDDFVLA